MIWYLLVIDAILDICLIIVVFTMLCRNGRLHVHKICIELWPGLFQHKQDFLTKFNNTYFIFEQ